MRRISFLSVLVLLVAVSAGAQELKTGYFLDDYVYGYRLNPSATPSDSTRFFLGLLVGDMTLSTASNVGASNIFFPIDGTLYNGLNSKVPAEQFIGGLPEVGKLDNVINLNILTVGLKSKRGYFTFEANVKSNSFLSAPKGLFEFLKVGGNGVPYSMDDAEINTVNYVELAGGYSYQLNSRLKIGGAAKALVGLGYANSNLSSFSAMIDDENVVSSGSGGIVAALPGLTMPVGKDGNYDLNNAEFDKVKPSGFGAAIDLGVSWKTTDNLTLSAAILDLGAVCWKINVSGELNSDKVSTPVYDSDTNKTLLGMFGFRPDGKKTLTKMLPATLNVGARYLMPFYDKLSAGILGSFRIGDSPMTDVRLGVTFSPSHVFSMALSGGATNYGAVFGGAFNLRLSVFDFFAGVDSFVFSITPQMLPVNKFNSTIKAGVTIAIQ